MTKEKNDLLVLRRKPRVTGWLGLGWRLAAMAFLFGLLVLIHWIERDGLKDSHDGAVSFLDVIYFTMVDDAKLDRLSEVVRLSWPVEIDNADLQDPALVRDVQAARNALLEALDLAQLG